MLESGKDEDSLICQKPKEIYESRNPQKIDKEDLDASIQQLVSLLTTLKIVEVQEADLLSNYRTKYFALQEEVTLLQQEIENGTTMANLANVIDSSELASVLREIIKLKRNIDSFPVQSELVQYDRRFSELNALIQEKHCQTRNFYATYNALLDIKELMIKEISLLNSIHSQFRDATASRAGQLKLIDSMDGILKGTQQRLRKVELELEKEQKSCDAIKETYAAAVLKQREFHSLLKTFQDKSGGTQIVLTHPFHH